MFIGNDLKFGFSREIPLFLQSERSECGIACLAMIASYFGHETTLSEIRKTFSISLKGMALSEMIEIASNLKLNSRPLRLEIDEIEKLRLPCILHWDLNHFVILQNVSRGTVTILDPALGKVKYSIAYVSEHFTGVALELTPSFDFVKKSAPPGLKISSITGKITGLKIGLAKIFLLATVLEAIALILPILNQWITDEAIGSGEQELLSILCVGIVLLGIFHALITAVRSWISTFISTSFSLQWASSVMSHLLRLPIDFFEKRHIGDIVSRFGSVRTIEHTLTKGIVEVVLDGILSIGTLCMMAIYNLKMTLVSVGFIGGYIFIRWLRIATIKLANQNLFAKQALEQTFFLETIRGVRSVKLFSKESERKSMWVAKLVNFTNADLTLQKMNITFSSVWMFLSATEKGVVFWIGGTVVIDGSMTLGMLFAFLSYKEQFLSRMNNLVDRLIEIKMLDVQTERLSDIVMTAPEEGFRQSVVPPADSGLNLINVSFRYATGEKNVLSNVNLAINPGECIALIGPSGGGKTTLLKILLKILQPSSGRIELGSIPFQNIGLKDYRKIISTVMQDDQLYSGTIFDNICFFEDAPDTHWVEECARSACIHIEIMLMPMGYQTLVGDMGTVLSGGQKQRIMLARALYKKPKILFLDEATSHLDIENEIKINRALTALKITRVMIAHRPQSIAIADRVLQVKNGVVIEQYKISETLKNSGALLNAGEAIT